MVESRLVRPKNSTTSISVPLAGWPGVYQFAGCIQNEACIPLSRCIFIRTAA